MIYYSPRQGLDAVMFPVSEAEVFAQTEPGRFERIDGKKAIVNTDSRRVLSVVSKDYRVLSNRVALKLARKCCVMAFPNTAPAHWKVSGVEAPLTGGYCRIDLRHSGELLHEDWGFRKGKTDLYEPFLRVTNSYNRTRAFSIHFGVRRLQCSNGMLYGDSLWIKVPHDTPRIEEAIEQKITETKFRKARRELREQLRKLRRARIPPDSFRPIILCVLGLNEPSGMPEDRRRDWQSLMQAIDHTSHRYRWQERHGPHQGANAYALANALTDLASRPPGSGWPAEADPFDLRERSANGGSRAQVPRKIDYNFFRRERHTLQGRTGMWLRWFAGKSGGEQFLKKYLSDPYFPTRADFRTL